MVQRPRPGETPAEHNERVRIDRLRADAKRPMKVNLKEGIELSRWLSTFAGVARRD